MANWTGTRVLTDAQWGGLAPLIEAVRPRGKTEHHDQRRTVEAIIWWHRNGATWRANPGRTRPMVEGGADLQPLGPARGVGAPAAGGAGARHRARTWPSWTAPASVRTRRPPGRPERGDASGAGRARGARPFARGLQDQGVRGRGRRRSRGVAFALAPGQAHELPLAPGLLDRLPKAPLWVVGDRGLASHAFRGRVWDTGARPAIPPKRNEEQVACPAWIYGNRVRSSAPNRREPLGAPDGFRVLP